MPYPFFQYPNNALYYQQMQQSNQNANQSVQIQNGGFVIVKDINEAQCYPVAPGNSVTFKIESQPYICTKTLGFSQLDQPIFEVFKLVKEEKEWQNNKVNENTIDEEPSVEYLSISQGDEIKSEMNKLKYELMELKSELNELKVELGDIDKTEVVSA